MKTLEQQMKEVAWFVLSYIVMIVAISQLSGCGVNSTFTTNAVATSIPQPGPKDDDSVVRGIAVIQVDSEQRTAMMKLLDCFSMLAYAASTATTTVTYSNAPSVTFTINATSLTAGSFTGDTLSLGSFTITALKDNNLKICNPGGNTKCTQAILRAYNTGSLAGFINTTDGTYAAPVYTSGDNPSTALVLNSPGVEIEQVTGMPTSKHTVKLSDFTTTTFNVTSDFSNAGSGSYSMVFIVEYALAP